MIDSAECNILSPDVPRVPAGHDEVADLKLAIIVVWHCVLQAGFKFCDPSYTKRTAITRTLDIVSVDEHDVLTRLFVLRHESDTPSSQ